MSLNQEEKKLPSKIIEFSPEQREWLKTAIFPEKIFLNTGSQTGFELEILERDSVGHVPLASKRCGYKGFVLKVQECSSKRIYAAKLALPDDYTSSSEFDELIRAANLADAEGLFAIPFAAGKVQKIDDMPGDFTAFVGFLVPWVEGQTLEQVLKESPEEVTPEWICKVAMDLYTAIHFLERRNLKHDDLHLGNVMISQRTPDLALDPRDAREAKVVIIDTGSLKHLDKPTKKGHDDHTRYVETLTCIYNTIIRSRSLVTAHPFFIRKLRELIEKFCDEDISRHFPDPIHVKREIVALSESINQPLKAGASTFHPLDAISAEHLADDSLLLDLFVDELPWFGPITSRAPVVLTGPRGCGKSMVFRYMSVKTHLGNTSKAKERLSQLPFLGVYVGCSSDLQNNLLWLARDPERVTSHSRQIATFFLLVVLRELFKTLALIAEHKEIWNLYGLTDTAVDEAIRCCEQFLPNDPRPLRLKGKNRALHLAEELDRLRVKLSISLLHNDNCSPVQLPDALLGEITQILTVHSHGLKERPIAFLLDDYTSHRISLIIQRILNRIVWERKSSHIFKVSCEKFGFDSSDIDGLAIDADREFFHIDAGAYVIDSTRRNTMTRQKFVKDLINARLKSANWSSTAEILIGLDGFSDDKTLALAIRNSAKQGQAYYYFGLPVLANLWSGDIASLLHVVREMFIRAGVNENFNKRIHQKIQHEAIVAVSKALNERIRAYHPYGHEMSALVDQFGNMVRDILVNGSHYHNSRSDPVGQPRRMIRLEMATENARAFLDSIAAVNEESSKIAKELLRRTIFIELPPSRPKESNNLQTVRWQIRRILLPAFGSSLLRTGYLDVKSVESFSSLMTDPSSFCEKYRIAYALGKDKNSLGLFTEQFNEEVDELEED